MMMRDDGSRRVDRVAAGVAKEAFECGALFFERAAPGVARLESAADRAA